MGTRTSIKLQPDVRDDLRRYKRRANHDSYSDAIAALLRTARQQAPRTPQDRARAVYDLVADDDTERLTTHLGLLMEEQEPDTVLAIEDLPHIHDSAVACHLRHRAEQARDALRRGDADTAQAECERIITLATALM